MAENPNGWNHRMISSLPCGCFVGATTVESIGPKALGEHVLAHLRNGHVVTFCRWDDFDAQGRHCADYPHEQWQIDYKRRLDAFMKQAG